MPDVPRRPPMLVAVMTLTIANSIVTRGAPPGAFHDGTLELPMSTDRAMDPGTNRRKLRRGLYRIRYPGGLGNDVRTREIDGTGELTIAEPLYRARGYAPAFEDLPWHNEYFAARRHAE
jgi:hypothetical protein